VAIAGGGEDAATASTARVRRGAIVRSAPMRRVLSRQVPHLRGPRLEVMSMRTLFSEGRCLKCGMRVTVEGGADHHWRDGVSCGPVETHRPSTATNQPHGGHWKAPG
jgi:hypothetical protein